MYRPERPVRYTKVSAADPVPETGYPDRRTGTMLGRAASSRFSETGAAGKRTVHEAGRQPDGSRRIPGAETGGGRCGLLFPAEWQRRIRVAGNVSAAGRCRKRSSDPDRRGRDDAWVCRNFRAFRKRALPEMDGSQDKASAGADAGGVLRKRLFPAKLRQRMGRPDRSDQ